MTQATHRETLELKAALEAGRAFKAAKKARDDAAKAMEATEEWKAFLEAEKAFEATDAFKVWEDAATEVDDARKTYEELWATVKASEMWQLKPRRYGKPVNLPMPPVWQPAKP